MIDEHHEMRREPCRLAVIESDVQGVIILSAPTTSTPVSDGVVNP